MGYTHLYVQHFEKGEGVINSTSFAADGMNLAKTTTKYKIESERIVSAQLIRQSSHESRHGWLI